MFISSSNDIPMSIKLKLKDFLSSFLVIEPFANNNFNTYVVNCYETMQKINMIINIQSLRENDENFHYYQELKNSIYLLINYYVINEENESKNKFDKTFSSKEEVITNTFQFVLLNWEKLAKLFERFYYYKMIVTNKIVTEEMVKARITMDLKIQNVIKNSPFMKKFLQSVDEFEKKRMLLTTNSKQEKNHFNGVKEESNESKSESYINSKLCILI